MSQTNISKPTSKQIPQSDVDNTVATLNSAFDASGLNFLDRALALEQFKQHSEVFFNEAGEPFGYVDGNRTPLADCLTEFGLVNKSLLDGRSLPHPKSKADFKSTAEKTKYIKIHGIGAFEKLATQHIEEKAVVTQSDWRKLSLSQKVEAIKRDPDVQRKLKPDAENNRTFINHELLEKQRRIRGR